jgi:hypothetical protein
MTSRTPTTPAKAKGKIDIAAAVQRTNGKHAAPTPKTSITAVTPPTSPPRTNENYKLGLGG